MKRKKTFEYIFLPFSLIYSTIVYIRNLLFDLGLLHEKEFNIPVISVGNLTVGGTGKTPHVEYLIGLLKKDHNIAVLSRGYKRKTKGFIISGKEPSASEIGDEPCQIKRKFPEITVAVDSKRVRGIQKLMEADPVPDVIILDDAFQHRYVKPGLSILLIDYNRPVWDDFSLPFGRLREPVSSTKRSDIILITKSPEKIKSIDMRITSNKIKMNPLQHLYFTCIKPENIQPVFPEKGSNSATLSDNKPEILLFSGIANPRSIKKFIRPVSTRITELHFRDHHEYTDKSIRSIIQAFEKLNPDNRMLITTEKDAAKIRDKKHLFEDYLHEIFYIPIQVSFLNNDSENFEKQIINYVRDNKRNSVLHKK